MEFWDLFISVVVGGGGGAVLAYIAQTPSEKRLSLFPVRPFCHYSREKSNCEKQEEHAPRTIPEGFARI